MGRRRGELDDPGNWAPAIVPGPDDEAVITGGVPTITSADATVGSIVLSTNLQIDNGRTLTIAGPATSTWSDGNIVMSGAATVVKAGDLLWRTSQPPCPRGGPDDLLDSPRSLGSRRPRLFTRRGDPPHPSAGFSMYHSVKSRQRPSPSNSSTNRFEKVWPSAYRVSPVATARSPSTSRGA